MITNSWPTGACDGSLTNSTKDGVLVQSFAKERVTRLHGPHIPHSMKEWP